MARDSNLNIPYKDLFTVRRYEQIYEVIRRVLNLGSIANGFINVTDSRFGAKGDGITDDTAAILLAVSAIPPRGGILYFPPGDFRFNSSINITKPTMLLGAGASIGGNSGLLAPTRLIYTGSGIAIDVGINANDTEARGSILTDFNLENAGTGTNGIRINTNEPKVINVVVWPTSGSGTQFSANGILVGDASGGQVNNLLLRDVYVRGQPAVGISIRNVSEATLDNVRSIDNVTYNLQLGTSTTQANNVVCSNGCNFSQTVSGRTGVKVTRAPVSLIFDGCYLEVEGGAYAIDASNLTSNDLDNFVVMNSYFTLAVTTAGDAVGISGNRTNAVFIGNTFNGFTNAGVNNPGGVAQLVEINNILTGATPVVIRGAGGFGDLLTQSDLKAGGGYRHDLGPWYQENVAASQTNVILGADWNVTSTAFPQQYIALRAGSITGVAVKSNAARTNGTLTVTVFKNGSSAGLTAVLNGTNTTFKATTQAKDVTTFAAGDTLDLRITTDGAWTPTTADINAWLEIET